MRNVEIINLNLWSLIVPGQRMRLAPSGLPFQRETVLTPNLHGNIDVLNHYGAVLDLVTANHPLEIIHGRVAQGLVQSLCEFCTLDLPLSKACLVLGDSVKEGKVLLLPRVILI
jgi:hypothetical protein